MTRKGTHNPIIADNIARGLKLNEAAEIVLPTGRLYQPKDGKGRYRKVTLSSNGVKVGVIVARVLCWLHHGPPPTDEHEEDHIDRDPRNDSPANLRWATRSENTANISAESLAARKQWMRDYHADVRRKVAAHDELVEALRMAYDVLGDIYHQWPGRSTSDGQILLVRCCEALASATGEDPCELSSNQCVAWLRAALAKDYAA